MSTKRPAKLPESFLQLPEKDRQQILTKASQELARAEQVLEKDVWVCWTLKALIDMPGVPPLALPLAWVSAKIRRSSGRTGPGPVL